MEKKGEGEEYKHVCRLSNKKYPSGKSLGGHMRSHVVSKNYVPPLDKLKSKRKRGKQEYKERSARYRAIALIDSSSVENCSKSVIEVEQEQVALCLMMLSRDCSHRVVANFPESSANNCVIVQVNRAKEVESDDSADGYELGNQAQLNKFMKKKKYDHLSSAKATLNSTQNAGNNRCSICQKSFKTLQALGEHIITHRRDCNGESSTKGHCCPFCHKVFRSGQALGGHKRSHPTGSSSSHKDYPPKNHPLLIDLNLPASPLEENGDFMPW